LLTTSPLVDAPSRGVQRHGRSVEELPRCRSPACGRCVIALSFASLAYKLAGLQLTHFESAPTLTTSAIFALVTSSAIALSGTGLAAWKIKGPVWRVKSSVRENLKDPASAMFTQVEFNPATGAGCGFVNAKNGMGGYTGRTHFVLDKRGSVNFEPPRDDGEGTIEQRLESLDKSLAYNTLVLEQCVPEAH
jgi:hypothetical protein